MAHDLIFFPDYRNANPYQTLLYQHVGGEFHPGGGTITAANERLRRKGLDERVVFHLHWEDAVFRNEPDETAAWRATQTFLGQLERFLEAGGALLWTLHNTAPHDGRHLALHRALCERLAVLADLIHAHSHTACAWAVGQLGADPARVAVVPHGNYLPLYQPCGHAQAESRTALGLPVEARVVLLFGRLGAYKGAGELLEAFKEVAAEAPNLHLVIAGKQVDRFDASVAALPEPVRARVLVKDGFVAHREVERLFHAADAVALPYRAILTSGTALLALSLRRPVLAPAHPGLRELLRDGEDALLYEPEDKPALSKALRFIANLDPAALAAMQAAAAATAARHDWRQSGLLLRGLLYQLLHLRRPRRAVPADLVEADDAGHALPEPAPRHAGGSA